MIYQTNSWELTGSISPAAGLSLFEISLGGWLHCGVILLRTRNEKMVQQDLGFEFQRYFVSEIKFCSDCCKTYVEGNVRFTFRLRGTSRLRLDTGIIFRWNGILLPFGEAKGTIGTRQINKRCHATGPSLSSAPL
jgi:hypothetical protein